MNKKFNKIYVEITNKCNLACSFCSLTNRPQKEMSVKEFEIVINKIKDYTKSIYLHVKGEPLLHSNLDKILDICDKNNIKVNITTNGTLLSIKKDILLRHSINQINVSLHSENNYSNYFEDVFNTCDILKNYMTIIYRIWTLPTLDLDEISTNIVEKIKKHYFVSEDVLFQIRKNKNIKLLDNIYIDKDYEFLWPSIRDNKNNSGTCLGTRSHIAILSNGDIVPCCLDSDGIIKLGNIFYDNLDEVIRSELFQKIKIGFQNKKIVCELCKSCTYKERFK